MTLPLPMSISSLGDTTAVAGVTLVSAAVAVLAVVADSIADSISVAILVLADVAVSVAVFGLAVSDVTAEVLVVNDEA